MLNYGLLVSQNTTFYKQCKLQRKTSFVTTWVPKKFAILGKFLKIKEGDVWEDGWKVISVGTAMLDEDTVISNSQDYRQTRKASDI